MEIRTAAEAAEIFKTYDDWQYADREAAWKWMFERGIESAHAGLPDGALDGGWTSTGIRAYAKKLECENARLRQELASLSVDCASD